MGGIPLKQDLVTQLETLMGLLQQYRLADLAGQEEESTQAINQCLALVESMSPKRRKACGQVLIHFLQVMEILHDLEKEEGGESE